MKSYQTLYEELQEVTGDNSAVQLARFKKQINETMHGALSNRDWKFLETTQNITTEADTGEYDLQANLNKIISVVSLDSAGEIESIPEAVEDPNLWNQIKYQSSASSDIIRYYYQEGDELLIWPNYSTAGNSIQVRYRKDVIDMSRADYNTGTITSISNGAKALVGDSTVWTGREPLGEQWLRIAQTVGDYRWYRINSIDSATTITLDKKYMGTTISAGTSAYEIGEIPTIPKAYQDLLIYRPLALYYSKLENILQAKYYWKLYDGGFEIGETKRMRGLLGKMVGEQEGMLDAVYMKKGGQNRTFDAELLAKDENATLG